MRTHCPSAPVLISNPNQTTSAPFIIRGKFSDITRWKKLLRCNNILSRNCIQGAWWGKKQQDANWFNPFMKQFLSLRDKDTAALVWSSNRSRTCRTCWQVYLVQHPLIHSSAPERLDFPQQRNFVWQINFNRLTPSKINRKRSKQLMKLVKLESSTECRCQPQWTSLLKYLTWRSVSWSGRVVTEF